MTLFLVVTTAMLAVALLFVVRPLLVTGSTADAPKREALAKARKAGVLTEDEYIAKIALLDREAGEARAPRRPVALAAALALLVATGSILAYRLVGNPAALDPAARAPRIAAGESADPANAEQAPALEDAIAGLAKRLESNPEDAQGWMLLGRAHKAMQRFAEAKTALENAHRLLPDDVDVMVELAEARALAAPDHRLDAESLALIDRALSTDPQHQRAQWIHGIAALQEERYADAVATWEKLLPQLPKGSDVARSVTQQIVAARERGGLPAIDPALLAVGEASPETAAPAEPEPMPTSADGPQIAVTIELDPKLASQVRPGDTLFVFARAPSGPKMPLAIQRLPAGEFPITLTLDDSMGMMPALKLSQAKQVVVGARISHSGNAAPQAGDLEAISEPLAPATTPTLKLVIAKVVQ